MLTNASACNVDVLFCGVLASIATMFYKRITPSSFEGQYQLDACNFIHGSKASRSKSCKFFRSDFEKSMGLRHSTRFVST